MVASTTSDGKIRHVISYGGVSTEPYDCLCNGGESYGAPERDYEKISIPGKNGDVTFDNGRFKDASVKYTLFFNDISEYEEFKMKCLALTGAQRFEDSHHPNEFRFATISGSMEPSVAGYLNSCCTLELTFLMYPQRYLLTGEVAQTITTDSSVTNPTYFEALPLVKIVGQGLVTINGIEILIDDPEEYDYTIIDCEIEDAYYISNGETVNANGKITLTDSGFWKLSPGENTVSLGSLIESIEITPRWWTV